MAVVASLLTLIVGLFVTKAANTSVMVNFGWLLAAIGAVGIVLNVYMLARSRR